MTQRRFYAHPFSNNAMRAQIALDEKGLEYEYVDVDLFKGAHKGADYLAVNPRGQVPCLLDGDITIFESTAIVDYLDRRYPDPPLVPSDPAAMALTVRLVAEFHQKLDGTNIFGSVRFRGHRLAELGDRVDTLLSECRRWEGYLEAAGPFFAGEAFTVADIAVLPFFAVIIDGLGLPEQDFPRLHAWYALCRERPSVAGQRWFEGFAAERENAELKVLAKG